MPFEIVRNDITHMQVDAIVNAANSTLLGGGGVDGAIHRAAGPRLLKACRKLGGCEPGDAKLTRGYDLPARYVIHTVGPVWQGGQHGERQVLASCYRRSLQLASDHRCRSVAFPLISAGAYGYPSDLAVAVAVDTVSQFLLTHDIMVYLVVFGHAELMISQKLFRDIEEYIDDHYVDTHLPPREERERRRMQRRQEAASCQDSFALPPDLNGMVFGEADEAAETPHDLAQADMFSAQEAPYTAHQHSFPDSAPLPKAARKAEYADMAADWRSDTVPNWTELLKRTDEGFSQALLRLIDERGMTDAQCYKKANVDRKLFSKIRSNADYKPSKPTVFAFAVALELSLSETSELLNKAGFAISHSSKFDIIVEYFIRHRSFNIYEINEVLFQFDMPLLGSGMTGK